MRKVRIITGSDGDLNRALSDIELELQKIGNHLGLVIDYQQNFDWKEFSACLKESVLNYDGFILNTADFPLNTDEISQDVLALKQPRLQVFLKNYHIDPNFLEKQSVVSRYCDGVISGIGFGGYRMGVEALKYEFDCLER